MSHEYQRGEHEQPDLSRRHKAARQFYGSLSDRRADPTDETLPLPRQEQHSQPLNQLLNTQSPRVLREQRLD